MLIILFIVKKYLHARNGSKQFGVLGHEENFENFLALNAYNTSYHIALTPKRQRSMARRLFGSRRRAVRNMRY
jgi:hypothetical protein